ncbi:MAG: DNA polymerase III subunit alpha [bacterium]|nr:DNA polymerase III subunit alpha [bacterium]
MRFTHLHTHSHYSLLDGLAKIDALVARAKELGMDAIALTDHGNLYGAVEFYKKATAAGVKPILGVEAYIAPKDHKDKDPQASERYHHLILLVENETGWKNLLKLTTIAHLDGFYYKPRMDKALLRAHHEGLIALSACLAGEVARNLMADRYEEAKRVALEYQDIFGAGNFFLEIGHHPGIKETIKPMTELRRLSKETGIPLVATQDIHYLKKEDAETHDILLAVQTGNKLDDSDRLSLKDDDFSMRSPDDMAALFADVPEAITNTAAIADRCNIKLQLNTIRLPKFPVPEGGDAKAYLRKLLDERIASRYSPVTPAVADRMQFELSVIEKMGFPDYFLIVQDFINWAKERGIVVGPGRGSAAGSIVSYILGITDVDPITYDLLFERFLNPERIQMPDIDVDITDRRRDEVFGYLQEKYGMDHVAHIITFGTMAARAAVRDVGRALGISYTFCDQLAKLIPMSENLTDSMKNVTELKEFYDKNPDAKRIIDAAKQMEGVARHASVHACGTVISEAPLTDYLPLQRAPQDDSVILTQFEMHSVEDLGLLKMDLLGLKNLTIIEDAVRLMNAARPEGAPLFDIHDIPLTDAATFAVLKSGETTGIFQLESSGMRRYLKELKPTSIEDITAMVALYRPGPMELIPSYILRKHGKEVITYLHPQLEPILKNTYGVGIYQEQMMRIARDLAGYSLAEADTLRKAIGKKIKKLLDEQQTKLIGGMIKRGIPEATANAIWELFPPFARYGFNRCLTGDTRITDPQSGARTTLAEIYHSRCRPNVFTLNKHLNIEERVAPIVFHNGKKKVWEVMTRSGRRIKATMNHPLLTPSGWTMLEQISKGEKIAVPRRIPEPTKPLPFERHKLAVLGYLLAEGNLCHPHGVYFYSTREEEINDYLRHLHAFHNTVGVLNRSKSAISVYSKRKNLKAPSEAVSWIESLGLKYKKATQKFFPEFVFHLSNDDLAVLIAKMFQGDGCINTKRDPQIFYATSSPFIARDLQHLLLRFGILSTIHAKRFKYRGGIKPGYTVTLSRYDNIQKFISAFGNHLVGEKQHTLRSISATHPIINGSLTPMAARGSYDTIPVSLVDQVIKSAIRARDFTIVGFAKTNGFAERLFYDDARKIGYLRETVASLGSLLEDGRLIAHAGSDIYWDEIADIVYAGVEDTFDLTVPKTHNFIANDMFVHNSHAVCYAMVGYQTAYLRAHYPVEFFTSLLNSDSGDIERMAFLIAESKHAGHEILPPDINKSSATFTPDGQHIRFGLAAIKNVGTHIVDAIIEERNMKGDFKTLADLLQRVQHKDLNKKSLESLVKCGAVDAFGIERNTILGNIEEIVKFAGAIKRYGKESGNGLFTQTVSSSALRIKAFPPAEMKDKLLWEKELLGLYVSEHPMNIHKEKLAGFKAKPVGAALKEQSEQLYFPMGGVVTRIQKIVTKKGAPMLFATIEDLTDAIEVIVFPEAFGRTMNIWKENNAVLLMGRMNWKNGEAKFVCEQAQEL